MVIIGTKAGDTLVAGPENDIVYSLAGNDWLGDDITQPASNDMLYGWAGNDTFVSNSGFDSMFGGRGDDTFEFHQSDANVTIRGGKGSDTLEVDASLFAPGELDFLLSSPHTHWLLSLADGGVLDISGIEAVASVGPVEPGL